jgi:N-acetylglucosaminyl-diphospho-decaprenol L-rhamnosyltransferase
VSYAAIVVLHNSRDEFAALLRSLERLKEPPRLIVVDTGADDGGADLVPGTILARHNPGFGAANHLALEHVHEDVTILLNPDTEALDDALPRLAALARAHPRALHAPRLLNPDGSVQRSAHPLPGTAGAFLPALFPAPLLPRSLRERVEPFRALRPRTVGWAIAACLAAATSTLRELGPFNPRTHLFAEDMELCLNARARGIPTVYHPELALRHAGGHSVYRASEPFETLARRRHEAIADTLGGAAAARDDAAQALTFATRALVKRPNQRERAQLSALLKRHDPGGGPGRDGTA